MKHYRSSIPKTAIERVVAVLYEARYLKDGIWRRFEWWLSGDPTERSTASSGRGISRGYDGVSRYWIEGRRVTNRRYVRESAKDPALPKFRDSDKRPQRKLPREVMASLGDLARRSPAG